MIRTQLARRAVLFVLFLLLVLPSSLHAAWDGASWADYSAFLTLISPEVKANCRAILAEGQNRGREPGRMGQFGDSITFTFAYFRNVIVGGTDGDQTGHDYDPIRSWVAYNGTKPADADSYYDAYGKGADYCNYSGWEIINARGVGHPQLAVETGNGSVPGNYSWALVMYGTNDVDHSSFNDAAFKDSYRGFLQDCMDLGVIPVVSTIPPRVGDMDNGHVPAANRAIRELAEEMLIPLVDYFDLVLHYQPVNWHGTLIKSDGVHPSAGGGGTLFSQEGLTTTDGYAARTKLTLDMAEKLRRIVFEDGEPEVEIPTEQQGMGRLKAGFRK